MNRRGFFALAAGAAASLIPQARKPIVGGDLIHDFSLSVLKGDIGVISNGYIEQIGPAFASGVWQDAIPQIYFIERKLGESMKEFEVRRLNAVEWSSMNIG
jgi:hypothetical protein